MDMVNTLNKIYLKSGKPSDYRERSLMSPPFGLYPHFSIRELRRLFVGPRLAFAW